MHTGIIKWLLCTSLVILTSCQSRTKSFVESIRLPKDRINLTEAESLNFLLQDISNLSAAEEGTVGGWGYKSFQPKYDLILAATTDTNQLVALTSHKSPYVKMCAFSALNMKEYRGIRRVFEKHLFDTQLFIDRRHLGGEHVPINVAYFRILYPSLSKDDADRYRDIIARHNKTGGMSMWHAAGM